MRCYRELAGLREQPKYEGARMIALARRIWLQAGAELVAKGGRITPVQVLTLIILTLSGGLTVAFNDERFFKMRSTAVCITLSGILWVGLWRGKTWLEGSSAWSRSRPLAGDF